MLSFRFLLMTTLMSISSLSLADDNFGSLVASDQNALSSATATKLASCLGTKIKDLKISVFLNRTSEHLEKQYFTNLITSDFKKSGLEMKDSSQQILNLTILSTTRETPISNTNFT